MFKIDILASWSQYCDYPLFRRDVLGKDRHHFNKVILYSSDHLREQNFKDFLYETVKEDWIKDHKIDWFKPEGVDWRQEEAMAMLPYVEGDWIYFTEQDWFVKDKEKFYEAVKKEMEDGADAIGWMNPSAFPYLHPSCFFIKKEVLDKTQKDFRAHPEIDGCDHFAMITRDLEKLGAKIVTTEDMGFKYWEDCFHLGGMTQNYIDTVVNPDLPFHRPEIFYVYNYWAQRADVPQSPEFLQLAKKVQKLLLQKHPEIAEVDPQDSKWAAFFKP